MFMYLLKESYNSNFAEKKSSEEPSLDDGRNPKKSMTKNGMYPEVPDAEEGSEKRTVQPDRVTVQCTFISPMSDPI